MFGKRSSFINAILQTQNTNKIGCCHAVNFFPTIHLLPQTCFLTVDINLSYFKNVLKTLEVDFTQTLFAKQNDAGAQRLAKISLFNFTNNFASIKTLNYMLNLCVPFDRSMRQSPNLCAIKSFYFYARAKMVGEIDPRWNCYLCFRVDRRNSRGTSKGQTQWWGRGCQKGRRGRPLLNIKFKTPS